MLTDECKNRIYNWKFASAANLLDADATTGETELVTALSQTFLDSGWFEGNLAILVGAIVAVLVPEIKDA